MSPDSFSVLVVCTGNVNRSALGAALLETWSGWYLDPAIAERVRVTSAGLHAPVGSPMGRRARAIAAALGADGSRHRAEQITEQAIRAADLVLVSSVDQRESILGLVPGALQSTFTIREAGRIAETLAETLPPESVEEIHARLATLSRRRFVAGGAVDDDIIDPQGKGDDAYRLMARQEVPPLAALAGAFLGMPDAEVAAYRAAGEAAEFPLDTKSRDSAASSDRSPGRHEA